MSKTALATTCASVILAVGLGLPTVSGTASAEVNSAKAESGQTRRTATHRTTIGSRSQTFWK